MNGSGARLDRPSPALLRLLPEVKPPPARVLLVGAGAALYITPYLFGSQATMLNGRLSGPISNFLVSSQNPDLALPLCYISGLLIGILGLWAVVWNLRLSMVRRPQAA